jgi:hypothetical protein
MHARLICMGYYLRALGTPQAASGKSDALQFSFKGACSLGSCAVPAVHLQSYRGIPSHH